MRGPHVSFNSGTTGCQTVRVHGLHQNKSKHLLAMAAFSSLYQGGDVIMRSMGQLTGGPQDAQSCNKRLRPGRLRFLR